MSFFILGFQLSIIFACCGFIFSQILFLEVWICAFGLPLCHIPHPLPYTHSHTCYTPGSYPPHTHKTFFNAKISSFLLATGLFVDGFQVCLCRCVCLAFLSLVCDRFVPTPVYKPATLAFLHPHTHANSHSFHPASDAIFTELGSFFVSKFLLFLILLLKFVTFSKSESMHTYPYPPPTHTP